MLPVVDSRGPDRPCSNQRNIKFIAIPGARSIFSSDLTSPKLSFFVNADKYIRLKLVIFFYDLPASNKNANIYHLTAMIAHLLSQFNHVIVLLIPVPSFIVINFC